MARWGLIFMFLVALLVAHQAAAARVLPGDANGLTDQKNYLSFGGVGSYAGVGNNGIPFGGVGGGVGGGGGGIPFSGAGGIIGTGPNGGLVGVGGTIPGGVGTIGGVGGGAGGGAGALPYP